jgi:hypothetical protein
MECCNDEVPRMGRLLFPILSPLMHQLATSDTLDVLNFGPPPRDSISGNQIGGPPIGHQTI